MKETLLWLMILAAIIGFGLSHYIVYLHGWDDGWQKGNILAISRNISCIQRVKKP